MFSIIYHPDSEGYLGVRVFLGFLVVRQDSFGEDIVWRELLGGISGGHCFKALLGGHCLEGMGGDGGQTSWS